MSSPRDPEDLTARARIRDAAMEHFADHGFERATIRGIAERAGVSSGLIRHHFGSKEALRDACDEHVLGIVRTLNEQAWAAYEVGDLGKAANARAPIGEYTRYVARSLIDGGATELFDEIARMGEVWLASLDAAREGEPDTPARVRAAVVAAWGLALPIMSEHLSRVFGVDITTPEGDALLASALLELYSHPMLSPEDAAKAREGLSGSPASGLTSSAGSSATSERAAQEGRRRVQAANAERAALRVQHRGAGGVAGRVHPDRDRPGHDPHGHPAHPHGGGGRPA